MLRDYQIDIISRLYAEWRRGAGSVMVQMPTGTGKTRVLASVVRDVLSGGGPDVAGRCVWIVAHRRELVEQIRHTLARVAADGDGRWADRVHVVSVQWLARHCDDMPAAPALIVIDEAHHAQARSYRHLWERCPQARFLGLTATPCRMDGRGFTGLFDTLVAADDIAGFIRRGVLSLFDYVSIRPGSAEQRQIDGLVRRGADGDYQVKEMDSVLNRDPNVQRLYRSLARYAPGRKGIVYAVSIAHARRIAACYAAHGVRAEAIDSRTPAAERSRLVEEFRRGAIRVLVNVDVFSEGFDCPDVEFVQLARPTLSLAKYLQQVGRGLRRSQGKTACVFIDNVGLYRVFGLPVVSWDWEAMFAGRLPGRAQRTAGRRTDVRMEERTDGGNSPSDDTLEVVVSRDALAGLLDSPPADARAVADGSDGALHAWQDESTGLWGLRLGRRRITAARYAAVMDVSRRRAAVQEADGTCLLLDGQARTLWTHGRCRSVKILKDDLLRVTLMSGRTDYTDLRNGQTYAERPVVRRYGRTELLQVGRTYCSRTRQVYVPRGDVRADDIADRGFYLTVYDSRVPVACCANRLGRLGEGAGYVCLLAGDDERYYGLYQRLADGSIVVCDSEERFYRAAQGTGAVLVGRGGTAEEQAALRQALERLETEARGHVARQARQAEAERLRRLDALTDVEPFCAGRRWGLRSGGCVVAAPVYRRVGQPRGRCWPVEKEYGRWGVITADGHEVVPFRYATEQEACGALRLQIEGRTTKG